MAAVYWFPFPMRGWKTVEELAPVKTWQVPVPHEGLEDRALLGAGLVGFAVVRRRRRPD
jgi:MYXO-CTERM domain-containing protein